MTCKGYSARIEYDDADGILTGRIAGIRDGVGFHADSVEELKQAFREAVEDYIETCARIGREPRKPYSGRVMFRVDPEVHRKAVFGRGTVGQEPEPVGRGSAGSCGSWRASGVSPPP